MGGRKRGEREGRGREGVVTRREKSTICERTDR